MTSYGDALARASVNLLKEMGIEEPEGGFSGLGILLAVQDVTKRIREDANGEKELLTLFRKLGPTDKGTLLKQARDWTRIEEGNSNEL